MSEVKEIQDIKEAYIRVGNIIKNGRFTKANEIINKLYSKSLEIDYKEGVFLYYEHHIEILYKTDQNHSVIPFLIHMIKKSQEEKNIKLGNFYTKLGVVLSRLFDYVESFIYLKKGLEFNLNIFPLNYDNLILSYIGLANNYFRQNKLEKAIKNIDLGYNQLLNKDLQNYKTDILFFYLTIYKVRIFIKQDKLKEANKALFSIEKNLPSYNKKDISNYKEIDLELYILNDEYNYEEVILKAQVILKLSLELENENLRKRVLKILVSFHTKHKEFDLAFNYSEQLVVLIEKERGKNVPFLHNKNVNTHKEVFVDAKEDFEVFLKKDLKIASRLQENFFDCTYSGKLDISTLFKPSKIVSGDYIGSFSLDKQNNYYLFILADTAGKGIAASYMSFMLNGILKSISYNASFFDLKSIIKDINSILSDSFQGQSFVSLWAGLVDLNNNTLESVNAGHLPAYLINEKNKIIQLNKGTTVLGIFENLPKIESETIPFNTDNSIISYSDGITETFNNLGIAYEEKFKQTIEHFAKNRSLNFMKYLETDLDLFKDTSQEQDDVSCLMINYKNEID